MIRGYRNKKTGILEYRVNRKLNPKLNGVNINEKEGKKLFWVTFRNGFSFQHKELRGYQIKLVDYDDFI